MEQLISKLRTNVQEMTRTLKSGLKFGRNDVKNESLILDEMNDIIDEMENCQSFANKGILNRFFNSKSDANKYLTASQQEDLEKEFDEWVSLNAL
mgnify:CR=1 FL=1